MDLLFPALLRLLWVPALRRAHGDTLDAKARRALRRDMWKRYQALARPREPTVGAQTMVRFAAVTVATYRAFRARGMDDAEARAATTAVNWEVYRKIADPAWWMTRLVARDRLERMTRAMAMFMRFPYGAPGYQMAFVDAGEGTTGVDVRRCPAAELFARESLSPLCKQAFCDLDYPLADRWGVALERRQTLSCGAEVCDFRYRHLAPDPVAGPPA